MVDIFDEVSEDLRAERARHFFQRNGVFLLIAAVLVVVGAGGWQAWQWRQAQQRDAVAASFMTAMREAGSAGSEAPAASRQQALTAFERLAETAPSGYRTLAQLRVAALKAASGDGAGALALWDRIASDSAADPELRQVATFLWAQHGIGAGDPAAVQNRLATLLTPGSVWRPLALESQALLLLRTGDNGKARDILRQLVSDPAAPEGVRGRAGGLLTRLGETDANSPAAGTPRENAGG